VTFFCAKGADRDRNPIVSHEFMFQYETIKFMSCFISGQKGKDFFARGSPYSDGIAQVALSSPPLM
jgi:hypothetical protein